MKITIYLFLLFSLLLSGCAQQINEGASAGMRVQDDRAPGATIRMNSVNILDNSLQKWTKNTKLSKIAVESTNSRRTATGTLEAWSVLRNRTDFPLQIEGRITFFDKYERPVEAASVWKRVMLPAKSIGTYSEFSTATDAVAYYVIEIREGR